MPASIDHKLESGDNSDQLKQEISTLKAKLTEMDKLIHDLESSELRFKSIFENSSFGNKIINSKLEIIKVNKALTDLLGYSELELLGIHILDIAHPKFIDTWSNLQKELWSHKKSFFSIETCILKKDKTELWCHVTSIIFEDKEETLGYTIIEDISGRKELESKFKEANDRHLKSQKAQQQKIFDIVIGTQEEERKRIAQSLHNNLGQMFYAVKLNLDQINLQGSNLETSEQYLKGSKKLLSECIEETRRISHELTPTVLEDFGLVGAIQNNCARLNKKVSFNCSFIGSAERLTKFRQLAVYRIVQELMLNVIKHADASYAKIIVSINPKAVFIKIEDNGKGFIVEDQTNKGLGLMHLKSRLQLLDGNLNISSVPAKGTTVNVSLPSQ
jgi:PAS domain S-box-containing protein